MLFLTDDVPDPILSDESGADGKPAADRLATLYPSAPTRTHPLLGRVSDAVSTVLPTLERGVTYHYATAGLWSSHDLLLHLLGLTGPARVWIATWSMTEEPVRMLVQALDTGLITELSALLDVRVRVRNPKVLAFAKHNLAKVTETVCHAKVTVIENESWSIAIVGSANYTNNPRIEAGVVSVCSGAASFHRNWIEVEINRPLPSKKSPFSDLSCPGANQPQHPTATKSSPKLKS